MGGPKFVDVLGEQLKSCEGEPPRKRQRVEDPGAGPLFAALGQDTSSPRLDGYRMDVDWSMGLDDFRELCASTNSVVG